MENMRITACGLGVITVSNPKKLGNREYAITDIDAISQLERMTGQRIDDATLRKNIDGSWTLVVSPGPCTGIFSDILTFRASVEL